MMESFWDCVRPVIAVILFVTPSLLAYLIADWID